MLIQRTGNTYTATQRTCGVLQVCEAPTRKAAIRGAWCLRAERLLKLPPKKR
jgi:hypothetical protein